MEKCEFVSLQFFDSLKRRKKKNVECELFQSIFRSFRPSDERVGFRQRIGREERDERQRDVDTRRHVDESRRRRIERKEQHFEQRSNLNRRGA